MSDRLVVLILAGGASRRMGRDKALLTLGNQEQLAGSEPVMPSPTAGHRSPKTGSQLGPQPGPQPSQATPPAPLTLLGRTVQVAQALTNQVTIMTPWPERYRSHLPAEVRVIKEASPQGPLLAFLQGWHQLTVPSADWCLLLACDLPKLDAAVLQRWWLWLHNQQPAPTLSLSACSHSPGKYPPPPKKRWEPLCGFYHRRCLPSLSQRVNQGERSFQAWLDTMPVADYPAAPAEMFFNCNTPADFTQLGYDATWPEPTRGQAPTV